MHSEICALAHQCRRTATCVHTKRAPQIVSSLAQQAQYRRGKDEPDTDTHMRGEGIHDAGGEWGLIHVKYVSEDA
jgi:hypothetical protein